MGLYDKYKVIRKVRDAFLLALRDGFAIEDVYKWTDGEDSAISIVDATPLTTANFPAIVITALSGREQRYLGPDLLEQDEDGQDVRFTSVPVTVIIRTYTQAPPDRDELTDLIYEKLKIQDEKLAELGIAVRNTSIGNDTREFIQDRWWYTVNITIDVYTEWKYTEEEDLETLQKIFVNLSL